MPHTLLEADAAQTATRTATLGRYFDTNVTTAGALICHTATQCKASHPGDFHESQLHHVGRYYDLFSNQRPLRVVVVGQEYGHGPALVSLEDRSNMIVNDSGVGHRFKAQDGMRARNPHMKGCTSLLRLIFGLGLGADHTGEFLDINGERTHIFECFALVNFLLCSAVPTGGKPTDRLAGKPGRSTKTMRANCSSHFRAALDILEPTLVVAQGYGVREWIATAYGLPAQRPQGGVEQVQIGATMATLVSFSHPSAHAPLNWGLNERMRYLLDTVAPTIAQVVNSAA